MMYDAYLLVLLALKEVVTHTQTDGQTDRQTDRQTDICLSRAAFAAENNLYVILCQVRDFSPRIPYNFSKITFL